MTIWFLLLALQAHAQPHPVTASVLEMARRPVPIRTGIGVAHDQVATKSSQAQAFYDQALAYLHSYWWLEAARSFNQALAIDPALAVAHAGLSLAYTELNAPAAARDAMTRAQALAVNASDHDRRHIDVRAAQMAAERSGAVGADAKRALRAALDQAVARYPADVEFLLLRGMAETPDPAERGQGSVAASVDFYRKALALAPSHFAAHHYLTHAYENTGRIEEALTEGSAYATMSSSVPHARHMYGHNLRRAGRIEDAIKEFEAADALETRYFTSEQVPMEYDWHYQHNVDLLATSYQYTGRMKQAEALLRASFGIPSALAQQEFNKREWPVFLLSRGRVPEALDAATAMARHPSSIIRAAGHVMIGHARLALGEYKAAADEANAALRLMRASPVGAGIVADALQQLQGEFLLRTGQREQGRKLLEEVVAKLRAAPGPDAWAQASFSLESIARTARAAGEWAFASWAAAQMIEHDPNYAGGHYALGLVAAHEGDRARAKSEFEIAREYWRNSDADLEELKLISHETAK